MEFVFLRSWTFLPISADLNWQNWLVSPSLPSLLIGQSSAITSSIHRCVIHVSVPLLPWGGLGLVFDSLLVCMV